MRPSNEIRPRPLVVDLCSQWFSNVWSRQKQLARRLDFDSGEGSKRRTAKVAYSTQMPTVLVCRGSVSSGRKESQVLPLRSPGFPVATRGFDDLHAALFTESRTRGRR
jgi:hypothetical protein